MRRTSLFLLAAASRGLARQPGFSIHDDLLAYPQYEIVFSDAVVSEQEAHSLVESSQAHPTYHAEFTSQSDLAQNVGEAPEGQPPESNILPEFEYEIMNMPPAKYLCAIPILEEASPENRTATELAKAEEQKELARASERGWELLKGLNGECLHFMSGWWSYRFCFGREIVQYHALPSVPNGLPPVQDPNTMAYVLGRVPKTPASKGEVAHNGRASEEKPGPPNRDLQVKGDQRYLVQRLDQGTLCDLTGRERTIEVQYHCVPTMVSDRIAWIKEVTTCAYLMVVNTPRLCSDAAFLPPEPMRANPITCQLILPTTDERETIDSKAAEAERTGPQQQDAQRSPLGDPRHPPVIGGVVIGGHNMLAADGEGHSAVKLETPAQYKPKKKQPRITVVASRKAKAEGGAREVWDHEALEKLGLDPSLIDDMVQEMEGLAGENGWKLEVVEPTAPGATREIRGIMDVDEEGEEGEDNYVFEEEL